MNWTTARTVVMGLLLTISAMPGNASADGVAEIMLGCETSGNEDIMPGDPIDELARQVARAVKIAELIRELPERELPRKVRELATAILDVEAAARATPSGRPLAEALHGRSRHAVYGLQVGGAAVARQRAAEMRTEVIRGLHVACGR